MTNNETLSMKQKWLKPSIGILLLFLIMPLIIWELAQDSKEGNTVAGMTVAGIFLGYTLSRSKFGFAGPIKKLTQQGDGRQFKALVYLFMFSSILAGAAIIGVGGMATAENTFKYPLMINIGVGTILGGLLFGGGMVLATGCASGTLSDIGDGMVPALVVLLFFMIGSALGVNFKDTALMHPWTSGNTSISDAVGSVSLGVLINIVLLGAFLGIAIIIHKWKAAKGTQELTPLGDYKFITGDAEISNEPLTFKGFFSYKTWTRIFEKRWTWMMGVFMVTLWYAVIILAFKKTPGITGAYSRWGIYLFNGFGFENANKTINDWEMMKDSQSWQNIGIIIGAACAKLFSNEFTFSGYKNQKWFNWALYALGGTMMGIGARLAMGCNFGALFTGVTFGTGFGWTFAIFLFGSTIAMSLLTKKLKHETPAYIYKDKK